MTARRRIAGGSLCEAYAVELADGRRAFLKTRAGAAADEFAIEAAGLAWLAEPGTVRVPEVLDHGPDFLALEWVDPGSLSSEGEEELGRGLAGLHRAGAEAFGGPRTLVIGPLRLPNEPAGAWPGFLAERRLRPLLHAVDPATAQQVERVCDRLGDLCGPPEPPARLHGDLWMGNVHADRDGRAWLIDPAAYGGHREIDLAMLQLFGSPGRRFLEAYGEAFPLADGWRDRIPLNQLFPVLVHAALFGGHYVRSVGEIARRYV